MKVIALDHLVLTVQDIPTTIDFYSRVLGMDVISFQGDRKALRFGQQKINLHQQDQEFEPKAQYPTPGSADLCFVTQQSLASTIEHLTRSGIEILVGPVARTGALGAIVSLYFRDPDRNLIEVAHYPTTKDES